MLETGSGRGGQRGMLSHITDGPTGQRHLNFLLEQCSQPASHHAFMGKGTRHPRVDPGLSRVPNHFP